VGLAPLQESSVELDWPVRTTPNVTEKLRCTTEIREFVVEKIPRHCEPHRLTGSEVAKEILE
jgi:hypothetical protein